jgi:hypothetical protein
MRGHSKPAFTNIRFFPGVNGQLLHNKVETAESIKVVDYKFHESFKTALDEDHKQYDYALLKLERKVNLPEYLTLEIDYKLNKQEPVQIYGYNS